MSADHPVLAASAVHAAYEAEAEALVVARASLAAQALAARRTQEEANAEHRAKVAEATRRGEPIPPRPEHPNTRQFDDAYEVLNREEQQHHKRRDRVLAAVASEGAEEVLRGREDARRLRWEAIAPEVRALMSETLADIALRGQLMSAQDAVAGRRVRPSRADRLPIKPAMAAVFEAALSGRTLLDPTPLPNASTAESEHIIRDSDPDPRRPLTEVVAGR